METKMSASIPSDVEIPCKKNTNKTQIRNSRSITVLITRPEGSDQSSVWTTAAAAAAFAPFPSLLPPPSSPLSLLSPPPLPPPPPPSSCHSDSGNSSKLDATGFERSSHPEGKHSYFLVGLYWAVNTNFSIPPGTQTTGPNKSPRTPFCLCGKRIVGNGIADAGDNPVLHLTGEYFYRGTENENIKWESRHCPSHSLDKDATWGTWVA